MHDSFEDPVLGRVAWSLERERWEFDAGPADGRPVPASYYPADSRRPASEHGWDGVRACVAWLRANAPAARSYMTDRLFRGWWENWYDTEIDDVTTPDGFRDALRLSGVIFYEDQEAQLVYDDGGLFGGHGFSLSLSPAGEFVGGPDMFG